MIDVKQILRGELYFLRGTLGILIIIVPIIVLKQEWLLIITTIPRIIVVILIMLVVALYLVKNRWIFENPIHQIED